MNPICKICCCLLVPCLFCFILLAGGKFAVFHAFRSNMLKTWKQSFAISFICFAGYLLGSLKVQNPIAFSAAVLTVNVFCLSCFSLAFAADIPSFEPLPIAKSFREHREPVKNILLLFTFALTAAACADLLGSYGKVFVQAITHETTTDALAGAMPANKYLAFFTLLSGAGLAEEVPFRLFLLTLIYKLTKRPYLSIVIAAAAFGLYHLTPLNSLYLTYWHYPITQFAGAFLAGLVFGFLFIKRGFGTTVLAHTLADWLPLLLFKV